MGKAFVKDRRQGEKNTPGNHDLGWLTKISQRAETIQIISTIVEHYVQFYIFNKFFLVFFSLKFDGKICKILELTSSVNKVTLSFLDIASILCFKISVKG